uniref:Uncharacterized protein n=1 Tax=Leersia perrieri TaxID=77586 RepID=A0A1Y8Y4M3_9ORYZ
MSALPLF